MEWSHEHGKSNNEVCPFDTTQTQSHIKITMERFSKVKQDKDGQVYDATK